LHKNISKNSPILICGVGSIGERHLNNLLRLGYENIILFRKRNNALRTTKKKFPIFHNLNDALKEKPKISFITNPTSMHIETALICANSGSHIFIEKPLSHSINGIDKLKYITRNKNLKVIIGYMMRFHPCIKRIRTLLKDKTIGNILSTISIWGEYLPDWHPWEDYKTCYAAKKNLGGGPALTLSHDIDILTWFFGKPERLKAYANYDSNLKIETENTIDILLKYKNGSIANVHLDYLQKPPFREYLFIGNNGKIRFDYFQNLIEINYEKSNEIFTAPKNFERNDMFMEEVKYFINCIEKDIVPSPGIDEAYIPMDIALKAIRSEKYKKEIKL
jgi:predicted dehydrogenase